MTKLGILVGEDKWMFFREIFKDLNVHYSTHIYRKRTVNIPLLYGRLNRWLYAFGVSSMLKRNDICFFEWASDLLMVASHMQKKCSIVTRLHSFELYDWAPKIKWSSVDKIILVSNAMQKMFCDEYPNQVDKTVVIYNGIALDKYERINRPDFQFNIGMVCRVTPIKRVYEVILMLYNLKQIGYNGQLHIAGDLSENQRYTTAIYRLIKKLELNNNVILYGYVTDTPIWLQKLDIFISNSFWEGQTVALIEAMASGCFCLSHFWAGAEEMLPRENLYFTEAELQQKIITYAESNDQTKREKQDILQTIANENFDVIQTKAKIRQVIESVVTS